jgi:YVTN family beta-propeller protein
MTSRSRAASAAVVLSLTAAASGAETLLVANKREATVSLIDLATGRVRATLPTGEAPHEIAVSADGGTAAVANYGAGRAGSTLTVLELGAGGAARVARTIDLGAWRRPHGVAFLADGRLLVTVEDSQAMLVVDVARGRVEQAIRTGADVSHMIVGSPDGRRAYVANIGSGSVSVLDLAKAERVAVVPTGRGAEGIALSPDGAELWVTNREDDTVSVVDTAKLAVVATLPAADFPIRAEMTPDGRRVLVSCAGSGDLAVFDRASRSLVRRLELPAAPARSGERGDRGMFAGAFGRSSVPIGIEIAPDGRRVWIAHSRGDAISVVDLERLEKTGELRAGREPDGMAYSAR